MRTSNTARALLLTGTAVIVTSCTTAIRPVQCTGAPHQCNEVHDARFCEYEAVESEGPGCADLGLATSSHFCVVAAHRCMRETSYKVSGRHCTVTQLAMVRAGGECSSGLPTFMAP
jgi:hypothetical protein